jgi:hypothetical protein
VSSLQLANGLLQLKTLFEQMQVGDQPAKYLDTRPLVEALGLHQMFNNAPLRCGPIFLNFILTSLAYSITTALRQIQ